MSDQKYWLGFSLIPGFGPKRILRLHGWFGDLATAWTAKESALREAGLDSGSISSFLSHRSKVDLDKELARVEKAGAWLLTLEDASYPSLLTKLEDAPPVLFVRGRLAPDDELALSIVGTRKATRYGRDVAYQMAQQLAQQGITIISGMAHGVDSAAHSGALDVNGRTLAVLGCGVDVIYPRDNRELAQRIVTNGAIISEFPIGTQPVAANFPRRNRILSGLALGVLVVEAPEQSGALITAGLAAEQGREVFAIPANIFNKMGRGTNRLIQDGAKLVMDVEDILNELNVAHEEVQTRATTERVAPTTEVEHLLLQHLSTDPIHIDDLARQSGLPIAEITSTLTILELKGLAQMVGHMQYSLVYRP